MKTGKGLWSEVFSKDSDLRSDIVWVIGEQFSERPCKITEENVDGIGIAAMSYVKLCDTKLVEVITVSSHSERIPAKFTLPYPVDISAIVFLEGNAEFEWRFGATRYLRISEFYAGHV
ncbi:MAG TPA: hypothetical protein DIW81_28825 [Planctomycetaceae bacterium]|nr:hypothetical protein [Planctomycetaceae bacterium]